MGPDGTLAQAPVWMGLKRGPPNLFSGALIYLNITKQNIRYRKTWG